MHSAASANNVSVSLADLPSVSPRELQMYICVKFHIACGPGSSVGVATDYWLDGPGSSPGEDEIFRPSRPALGSTQPPVKWVSVLSQG